MNERIANNIIEGPEPPHTELQHDQRELMDRKWEFLEDVKEGMVATFGTETLPKDFVKHEVLPIRKKIRESVKAERYSDELGPETQEEVVCLTYLISHFREERRPIEKSVVDENGDITTTFRDGTEYHFNADERRLSESLTNYFDAYRLTRNAHQFRETVKESESDIVQENTEKRKMFHTEKEKREAVTKRVFEKYRELGFSEKEIASLVKTSELNAEDVREIDVIKDWGALWNRFMAGDKSKFVALSVAMSVPACLQGLAPSYLAEAFGKEANTVSSLGMYSLLSFAAAWGMTQANSKFRDFLMKNFGKTGGYDEYVAENVTAMPGEEIGRIGTSSVKESVANARQSYEWMAKTAGYDVLPAGTMLLTSVGMLLRENPALAGATVASAGLVLAIHRFIEVKGDFMGRENKKRNAQRGMAANLQQTLSAHMEMTLSGMKDDFQDRLEETLRQERVAAADSQRLRGIQDMIRGLSSVATFVTAGVVAYATGWSSQSYINALSYSRNFQEGTGRMFDIRKDMMSGLRDTLQLELMFNGYAAEEKEKEKDRIGMDHVSGGDLKLKDVGIEMGNKKILDGIDLEIPAGSMVSLSGISGAGKTTLLKVMSGYYRPTSGEVSMGGVDLGRIKKSGPDSIYSKIAYLPQLPYIIDGSIRENLTFGITSKVEDQDMFDVLQEVGLGARFGNLAESLRGGNGNDSVASGGEKLRIGLARAILKMRKDKSRVIFFDEPTAAVDPEMKAQIGQIVNAEKAKNPEVTFIAISHDRDFTEQLEGVREVKMKNGKIVGETVK